MSTVVFMLYFWTCDVWRYRSECSWQYNQTFVTEQECKQTGDMLRQRKIQGYSDRTYRDENREYRCVRKTAVKE